MSAHGRVIVITGAMAAGKSSVADLLAIRLPKSVHIHGDMFRRMVINGRANMTPNPSADALAQLNLRYDLAAQAADRFAEEGFDAIVQDVILGKDLADFVKRIASHERYLVVLSPACRPWSGKRSSVRRPATSTSQPKPWTRCCDGRLPKLATGWTAVAKPRTRQLPTSLPISQSGCLDDHTVCLQPDCRCGPAHLEEPSRQRNEARKPHCQHETLDETCPRMQRS